MKKIILLVTSLLYSIGISQMLEDGFVSFRDSYDKNIFKKTGEVIFNEGMKEIRFNKEVIATIENASNSNLFAYSLKNRQLKLAVNMHKEGYAIMYTIDMESKAVKKKERLDTKNTYKDSDLELSIIGRLYDTNSVVMQYTWKGKTNKIILPAEMKRAFGGENQIYISKNGYIVTCQYSDPANLYIFSMDKKKFTDLGRLKHTSYSSDFYIPLNEYVIYYPQQNFTTNKIYLYRYVEEELYATRYQKANSDTKDTIISNMRKGNTYEQFLPLTKVENIDSLGLY